jgi:hypothetical protein
MHREVREMNDVQNFSKHVIDYAQRLADMADAAEGHGRRKMGLTRWLVLPALGAGLYALATNGRTKGVMDEAKTKATELPEDLVKRVRQSGGTSSRSTSKSSSGNGSSRKTQARRSGTRRKTASSR